MGVWRVELDYLAFCFSISTANSRCKAASRSMSDLGEGGSSAFTTFFFAALAMARLGWSNGRLQ
jgi:hypothetical protein